MKQHNLTSKQLMLRYYLIVPLMWISANFAHPVTPTLIGNLGLHDYMFGVAFASMCMGNFLTAPFWGKYMDQIGRRRVFLICGIGYGLGQLLFMIARTEPTVVVARVISGIFAGGYTVAYTAYVVDNSTPDTRGRNLTIMLSAVTVLNAVGYLIGGFLGNISIPMTFMIQSVCLMLAGVLSSTFLLEVPGQKFRKKADFKPILKESNPFGVFQFRGGHMTRSILLLSFCALFVSFGFTAYEQCFNYYIKDFYGFLPSYNGMLKALLGMVTLAVNFTVGLRIVKKSDLRKSMTGLGILCAAALAAILVNSDLIYFIIVNIFIYAFIAVIKPVTQAIYSEAAKGDNNGKIMGLYTGITAAGNILGALTAGFIYDISATLPYLFAAVAFLGVFALGSVLIAWRKKHTEEA